MMSHDNINIIFNSGVRLKKRERFVRTFNTVITTLFYSSTISVIIAFLIEFRILNKELVFLIPLVLSSSVIIPAGMEILKLVEIKSLLLNIDREYRLNERLTTAYELIVSDNKTVFFNLIIDDAADHARKIEPKNIYLFKISWKIKVIPALLLMLVVLSIFNIPALFSTIYSEGILLEEYAEVLASRAGEDGNEEEIDLYREMEKLGKQMRQNSMIKEDVIDELNKLQEKVRQQIIGLERTPLPDSTFKSLENGISEEFGVEIGRLRNNDMSDSEIQELRTGISESGELTEEQKKRAEKSFKKYNSQSNEGGKEQLAEDLLDSLQSDKEDKEKLKDLQDMENLLEKMTNSISGKESGDEENNSEEGKDSDSGSGDPDEINRTDENTISEDRRNETAGEQKGDIGENRLSKTPGVDSEKDQYDSTSGSREGNTNDTSQLEGESINQDNMKVLIRNLPDQNDSFLTEEEIIMDYSKRIEEVIEKEELPLYMREYIKEYFLKIGTID